MGSITNQFLPVQLEEPNPPFPKVLRTTFGKIKDMTHPLFQRMGKELDAQLSMVPIYRYWKVKPPGRGLTHPLELCRRRARARRAKLPRAQDGPRLDVDHPPLLPGPRQRPRLLE